MNSRIKLISLGLLTIAVGALGGTAVTAPAVAAPPSGATSAEPKTKVIEIPEELDNLTEDTASNGWGQSIDVLRQDMSMTRGRGTYYLIDPKSGASGGVFMEEGTDLLHSEVDSIEKVVFRKPASDVDVYFSDILQATDDKMRVASYKAPRTYEVHNLKLMPERDASENPVFTVKEYNKGLGHKTYLLWNPELDERADTGFLVNGEEGSSKLKNPIGGVQFAMSGKEIKLEVRLLSGDEKGKGALVASAELLEQ
ncbi:MAG: hypothetical protein H0T78_08720 [Longispora sp.]|nr:hypothetical protein [Longispora sp. (in: high G+C Gram-positive bacteria)]